MVVMAVGVVMVMVEVVTQSVYGMIMGFPARNSVSNGNLLNDNIKT